MASASNCAPPVNRRARSGAGVSAPERPETEKKRQWRGNPLPDAAAAADADVTAASMDAQLDLLWSEIQNQMLELLTHGVAAPFQWRAFDRLDFSMKQFAKARSGRAEELRGVRPAEPDAEELAAMLNKIDRRIDELAEDRFKKLAGGQFPAPAMDEGGSGMDV